MKKWAQSIVQILNGFLIFAGLYCTIVRQFYDQEWEIFLRSLIVVPIMIVISVSAHKAKHFWIYAIASAISVFTAYIASPLLVQKVWMLLFTVLIVVSYFIARGKKQTCWLEKPEYAFLLVFLLMYFMAGRVNSTFLRFFACYGAGIYYLMISYYTNSMQISEFVQTHSNLERFPEKRLIKSNRRMMWIQNGFVAAAMFIAPFAGIDQIIYGIGRVFRNILAWILSGFETDEIAQTAQEAAQESQSMMIGEAKEPSKWMEILLMILDIFGWILLISFLAFLLYKIGKKMYEMYLQFGEHMEENGDKVERIVVSCQEEKAELKKVKKENLFWNRSPNARIRKFYKKRVQKDRKEPINPAWTPEEIERLVDMEEKDKQVLHTYYEKARYGSNSCTKEEMQKVLNIR